jgi:hypothetical protein
MVKFMHELIYYLGIKRRSLMKQVAAIYEVKQQNHNTKIDNGIRHKFAYVSEPLSQRGGLLIILQCFKNTKERLR